MVKTPNVLTAGRLGLVAGSDGALAVGSAQGPVLLGRPVDVSFDVSLDAGMALETACLPADIVSGEESGCGRVMHCVRAR